MERYGKDRNHSEITPKFNVFTMFHDVPCNFQPVQIEADYGGSLCTGDSKASRGTMLTHGMMACNSSNSTCFHTVEGFGAKLLLDTS